MQGPDSDMIGREHRKRLERVRETQRRAMTNIVRPYDPKSCRFCKYYIKKDEDSGYCLLWKRIVKASESCLRFERNVEDDIDFDKKAQE